MWHTCVIYFGTHIFWRINPVNLRDNTEADYHCYSTCIIHLVVIVTNMEASLYSHVFITAIISKIQANA